MPAERPMTLGEQRVRLSFNPSAHSVVDEIKWRSAELIDLCGNLKRDPGEVGASEVNRCLALAQTHYEDAAMWAVKAATAPAANAVPPPSPMNHHNT